MQQTQKRQIVRVTRVAVSDRESGAAPIPDAVRIGNIFASSLLPGRDMTAGGSTPADPDAQAAAMFRNIRSALEQVGGTPEDIVQFTVYIQGEEYRPPVNKEWLKMFPDPDNRPARIVVYRDFGRERTETNRESGGTPGPQSAIPPARVPIYFEVSFIAVLATNR